MDKEYEKKYHESEEKNWWFVARRDAVVRLLDRTDKEKKILDIGCAGGALISDLTNLGFKNVYGLDFSETAVELCHEKDLKNVFVMDAQAPSFEDNSFDIIVASDSLEHLENDAKALLEWKRILKKNGRLIVFVPAYTFLWSEHDEINHHFRRYSKRGLQRKLESAGFEIEALSFWNFYLFFPTALLRIFLNLFRKKNPGSPQQGQIIKFKPVINAILIAFFKIENRIFRSVGLPVGVSVYASARKTEGAVAGP
ncbi:MAG TPA: class I SAM-dependent methyltransferase [Bacteroidia bacterium]